MSARQQQIDEAGRALAEELGPVLPRLVAEYLEIRDQTNALEARRKKLRDLMLPLLEDAGGAYIDEIAGVRVYIKEQARYEYDAGRLHSLVKDGVLYQSDFDDALKTVIDKGVVDGWLKKGLITDRQLARANAKEVSQIVRQIQVDDISTRRTPR